MNVCLDMRLLLPHKGVQSVRLEQVVVDHPHVVGGVAPKHHPPPPILAIEGGAKPLDNWRLVPAMKVSWQRRRWAVALPVGRRSLARHRPPSRATRPGARCARAGGCIAAAGLARTRTRSLSARRVVHGRGASVGPAASSTARANLLNRSSLHLVILLRFRLRVQDDALFHLRVRRPASSPGSKCRTPPSHGCPVGDFRPTEY